MSDSYGIQNLSLNSPRRPQMTGQCVGLYSVVAEGRVSLQQLVSDWVNDYKNNQDDAMVRLVQFFISASGCKGQVSQDMMETMQQNEMINFLAEEFDLEAASYPILGQGAAVKKIRGNINDFILLLVKKTQNSVLYDGTFMDILVTLLTALSTSQVRPFRHTTTFSAMCLMTVLIHVWGTVFKVKKNLQGHLAREQCKPSNKQEMDKLENLSARLEEMEENRKYLEQMIIFMFQSVFVHRYRDVAEEIRCLCMTELGAWMTECPDLFLEDSYLKYLGWPLSDKAESVRLCTIKSLLPMYEREDMMDKLALFTEKFKARVHSMILDKNIEVSVIAIQLLQLMMSFNEDSLTEEQCENVYMLVYSVHKTVARAAANFLLQMQFKPSMLEEQARTRRGKKRLPNTPYLRSLVQFYIESGQLGYESYLVDSLINTSMMKDWECMTDLLLEECGSEEEEFDQDQETALVTIMVETIKQVVTGEMPPGRGHGRKVQSGKEIKQMASDKELVTSHFMVMLPHIINKYLLDEEKMIKLLSIPQFMDLEMYTTSRQERALDGLLRLLTEVVEKHTGDKVLDEAFKTLSVLCNPESSIYGRCNSAKDILVDAVTLKLRTSFEELDRADEEVGADEMFDFENSFRKLSLLYKHHDPGHTEDWDILYSVVRRDLDKKDETIKEPEVAIISALTACYYLLLWENKRSGGDYSSREKADMFIIICRMAMVHNSSSNLAEEAFISMCDLLVVLSSIRVDDEMVEELTRNMQERVFDRADLPDMETSHDEVLVDKITRER